MYERHYSGVLFVRLGKYIPVASLGSCTLALFWLDRLFFFCFLLRLSVLLRGARPRCVLLYSSCLRLEGFLFVFVFAPLVLPRPLFVIFFGAFIAFNIYFVLSFCPFFFFLLSFLFSLVFRLFFLSFSKYLDCWRAYICCACSIRYDITWLCILAY